MIVEKRKHARFVPQPNTFAALGKEYTKVGKLIDICKGGLSFEYLAGEDRKLNSSKVDIFLVGNVFYIYNVPCKMVYDIQVHVPHVNNTFIKKLTTKRCGLAFQKLTEDDGIQLKLFLQAYTTGLA